MGEYESQQVHKPNDCMSHELASSRKDELSPEKVNFWEIHDDLMCTRDNDAYHKIMNSDHRDGEHLATSLMIDALITAKNLTVAQRHDCLDKLYDHIGAVDVLKKCIKARFDVDLIDTSNLDSPTLKNKAAVHHSLIEIAKGFSSDPDQEEAVLLASGKRLLKDWTRGGAKGIYRSLLLLSPSQHEMVHSVMYGAISDSGGRAVLEHGCILVYYTEENLSRKVRHPSCDMGDAKYGLPIFESTVIHEIAHILDGTAGKYSGGKSEAGKKFRKFSGWTDGLLPTYDSAQLLQSIIHCLGEDNCYPKSFTVKDKEIARAVAKSVLENKIMEDDRLRYQIIQAYQDCGCDIHGITDVCQDFRRFERALKDCTLFKYMRDSWASEKPWLKGRRNDRPRQIHQGYEKQAWHAFDSAAFDKKVSYPQLREPSEDFAEVFTVYHVAAPKGKGLRQEQIKWIEDEQLHKEPTKKDGEDDV